MQKYFIFITALFVIVLVGCSYQAQATSYPSVVLLNNVQYGLSVEKVPKDKISIQIGVVKRKVNPMPKENEESNDIPVGSKLYEIKGINPEEAIAVEIGGEFQKAYKNSIVKANWESPFLVNKGNIYVISENHVEPEQIGTKIGKVTKYTDQEGTYSGSFSNKYPKGTEFYEIIGVERKSAIAVQENEVLYIKAIYSGEYTDSKYSEQNVLPYIIGFFLSLVLIYLIKKKINR